MERGDALADFSVFGADACHEGVFLFEAGEGLGDEGLLDDLHVKGDVELFARGEELADIFARDDAVDGGAVAGAEEVVTEVLADDGVSAAGSAEDVCAGGDFAVGQKGGAGHGVVPVAVEAFEGEGGGEGALVDALHFDAALEGVGKPDERADFVPEAVAGRETGDEDLEAFAERERDRGLALDHAREEFGLGAFVRDLFVRRWRRRLVLEGLGGHA